MLHKKKASPENVAPSKLTVFENITFGASSLYGISEPTSIF